ncbi:MAG: glycosyltransferase [Phycisphaerae bacterium]
MAQRAGIMFVIDTLLQGGAEHVLFNLAQGLVAGGKYRPVVVCLKEAGPLAGKFQQAGVPVFPQMLKDKYDARVLLALVRLIQEHHIKIVIPVGGGERMFWSTLAAKIAGVKSVIWSQTFSQPGHPEFDLSNRMLYPLVDKFIALGARHKLCLALRDKVPEGKIAIITNGIEVHHNDSSHWRDRARSILGLADENVLAVGMIANLTPSKRHDIFIQAARQVVGAFRDIHFFIIGDGPSRNDVRMLAQKSELLGRYLSLLGHREDVPQLLPGLDLVCQCSEYHECQSVTALQAMASGVPVISNFIGSMDEAIIDNQTGFFYETLTPTALAKKILQVAPKPALRQSVSQAARKLVEEKFSCQRLVKDFIELFDNLLAVNYRCTGVLALLSRNSSSVGE